jgi:hypothetical protein
LGVPLQAASRNANAATAGQVSRLPNVRLFRFDASTKNPLPEQPVGQPAPNNPQFSIFLSANELFRERIYRL